MDEFVHFFEDVPSEIVIFGSLQGALGAILGSFLGSHFFILKRFKSDVKKILRTPHFLQDVPSEMQIFCRAPFFGLPRSSRFSQDVCSESAIFNMTGSKTAFNNTYIFKDVSGGTLIFHAVQEYRHSHIRRMSLAKWSFLIIAMSRRPQFSKDVSAKSRYNKIQGLGAPGSPIVDRPPPSPDKWTR